MSSSPKNNATEATKRTEKEKSDVCPTEMEIHEWNVELRTNNVRMDEHTSDVRMDKIKAQRRQDKPRKG